MGENSMMKKILLLVSFFFLIFISSCSSNNTETVRLRIIAASDNQNDINDKNVVKNAIKELFDDRDISYQLLNEKNLKEKLFDKLDYSLFSKLKIKKTISHFEAKSYKGKFIPSGDYETLLILIGDGNGHNFWTLLYPEYYGLEFEETNEIEYRSYFYDLLKGEKK